MVHYSALTKRVSGSGADAWILHQRAMERAAAGEDIIILSIGDDRSARTPEPVVDAAINSLQRGRHHYTTPVGNDDLRAAIAAGHQQRCGLPTTAAQVAVTSGAQNALFCAIACLCGEGDEVVVPEPCYATYPATLGAFGATVRSVGMAAEEGFRLDPERLAAAVSPRTRALVLNSPNNPTGAVYGRAALEAVAELCRKHDIMLISDEVYADFAWDAPHIPAATLPGMQDLCVTVNSLSKSHHMTGWRLGWLVGPVAFVERVDYLLLCMLYGAPPFIQDAAVRAFSLPEADTAARSATLRARRDLVCDALGDVPGLIVRRPQGGMFVMLDVRPMGLPGFDVAAELLDRHGVSLLPAEGFGASATGHLRLSLTAPEAQLQRACDALASLAREKAGRRS